MATAEIRQHISTAGSLTPRETALHSTPLRETFLPRPPHDARSALPVLALACVLRGKRCPRTPCPSMPHDHAAGGVALLSIPASFEDSADGNAARPSVRPPGSLRSRLPRSRFFSTRFSSRAGGKRVVDKTAKPMKSFFSRSALRERQSARPFPSVAESVGGEADCGLKHTQRTQDELGLG